MKSKCDILLALSPASSQSLASVFLFFTAQIKANRRMYHQHGTKNRIQRTATMEDTKRVWASCFLLEFCPSPCSYVSKVGGVGVGGWKKTDGCVEVKQSSVTGSRNATAESVELRMTPSFFYRLLSPDISFSPERQASIASPFH